jgi:hypothetical protein
LYLMWQVVMTGGGAPGETVRATTRMARMETIA